MTEWTRLISYLLYGLFIIDRSQRSIETSNWSADSLNKKTLHLNEMYTWACITVGDTGQRIPFWQLSMDHNMDVHKDVHLLVNADYALDT